MTTCAKRNLRGSTNFHNKLFQTSNNDNKPIQSKMNNLVNKAKKKLLDSLVITVQGGKGGPGMPRYGGIGGKGGDVYITGSSHKQNLRSVAKKNPELFFKAGDGSASRRTQLIGQNGQDLIIKLPLGVSVEDERKQVLGDINSESDSMIVAMGGRGGDKFNDSMGFVGQKRRLHLNLKLISDAVLVGFPNAGKSKLLSVISRAKPRIAAYPFTTLKPNLATLQYPDFRQLTLADLPGLVEGAHKNLGLGHEFLKHIARTKLMVFVVDINKVDLGPMYTMRSPLETICILIKEMELYDDTLLSKPAILAVSKMDSLEDSELRFEQLKSDLDRIHNSQLDDNEDNSTLAQLDSALKPKRLIKFERIIATSSEDKRNVSRLAKEIRQVIDEHAESNKNEEEKVSSYRELQSIENNRIII